ncbi:MAG: hypothetical protein KAR14_02020 [Candidatus Aminicenantes bacterium]|nr:hypothetical protein [Candidatus Aminicenantes bacterium]
MSRKMILIISMMIFASVSIIPASYQGVLMNSAETINPGNFKLTVFPTMIIGKNGGDNIWGVAGKGGLGLTRSVDIEVKGAIFKNFTYFGVDLEYWFYSGRNLNASIAVGWHMIDTKIGSNSSGIDTAVMVSTKPSKKLELYGGLKLSFDEIKNTGQQIDLIHVIPGLEYRVAKDIDFLAEFGIALNGESRNYLSFGFAYYFLR